MKSIGWLSGQSVKDGLLWFVIQVAVGLIPLWGTALLLSLFQRHYELYDFMQHGEFALYAASLIGGGLYSLRYDIFPMRSWLQTVLVIFLVISTLIFTATTIAGLATTPKWLVISREVLSWSSATLFISSALICFGIVVAENGKAGFNVPSALRGSFDELGQELDALMQKKKGGK